MKKFLFLLLVALSSWLLGWYGLLIGNGIMLSLLPFGMVTVMCVFKICIIPKPKTEPSAGIFGRLETFEKVGLAVVIAIILAIVGFCLWGIIDNFFPEIGLREYLSFVGVIIDVFFFYKATYFLRSLVNFFRLGKAFNPMEE